jgi:hypothetical protein
MKLFAMYMALLQSLVLTTRLEAQSVRVVVLDALSGKPQSQVKVEYFCSGNLKNDFPIRWAFTDATGAVEIPFQCTGDKRLELFVIPADRKEQCGGDLVVGFDEIFSTGIISDPTADGGIWCPTRVSKKLKPLPGQVIMFVKKPTWWQSHVAG